MYYYEIAPSKIVRAGSNTFTYASTEELTIGSFVAVPVGKTTLTGLVISRTTKPEYPTKEIASVLEIPPLPQPLISTGLWIAEYYHTPLATVLQTILPRGITKKRRVTKKRVTAPVRKRTNFVLNKDQATAISTLSTVTSGSVLLHGVTGSGKTAVYIEYAKQVISRGKSVILLVPEIALTSQLVAEFKHYFPNIILTHSHQTEAERHLSWLEAANSSEPRIVIGPRSALFMPLLNIGAIIIDESHEPSFKQEQSPRYSALRVAGVLAKEHGCIAVQGSATPLVAEYYLASHHRRPIITLPRRARSDAKEPQVAVINMTKKALFTQHRFMSDALLTEIKQTIERNGQVLLFHNRRGSASTTLCENCGWSALCPRCFVPYTLHADTHQLRCHICDTHERVPTSCPSCHSTDIIHKGIGTKLIEHEISRLFPKLHIARFDGDSKDSESVEQRYQDLYDGEIDVIIGTQVIAKGLDLPRLRTVGVIQADAGLSLPDFASPERTFQLLAQVIGRVGRSSHETKVIIQSYQPEASAVRYGITQNYESFYDETIALRKKGSFPPFSYLLRLTCVYRGEAAAIRSAQQLAKRIRTEFPDVRLLGPTPSFYERQHDTYRWQITIKSPRRSRLLDVLDIVPSQHWQYDMDPASLL